MTTVDEIRAAIERLAPEKLAELRRWFAEFDAAEWDRQFEADARAGKLDAPGAEALGDLNAGRCTEL
jgi:hypothetical protein